MYTFDFYSYTDANDVNAALSQPSPFLVPRINGTYYGAVQSFEANYVYGFEYIPYSILNGLGVAGPVAAITAKNYIERQNETGVSILRDGITYRKRFFRSSGINGIKDYYDLG